MSKNDILFGKRGIIQPWEIFRPEDVAAIGTEAQEIGDVAVTAEAEEMTGKCLRLFAATAVRIVKCLLDPPEINPYIAVIVLKKWEIGVEEGHLTDQMTNIKLNLKPLTSN